MTTKADALRALIEKVKAGEFTPSPSDARAPYFNRFCDISENALPQEINSCSNLAFAAYNGSLDAAKALHEAVLPGWTYAIRPDWTEVRHPRYRPYDESAHADNDARAWLLAILQALLSQEEAQA